MHRSLNIDEATLAQFCEKHHIRRLALFGSRLKGTAGPDSDIDLLVEFDPATIPGLMGIAGMEIEDRIRIEHMIDAAGSVARFIVDRRRNDIDADEMLRFAQVRAIEIIGEAASKVSADTRNTHSNIPWQPIVGMRNRLVHAYFDIDADILWVAATQEVPALLRRLQALTSED